MSAAAAASAAAITAHHANVAAQSAQVPSARYVSHTPDLLARASSAFRAGGSSAATSGNPSLPAGGSASPLELVVAAITDLQRRVAELEDMVVEEEEDEDLAPSSKRGRAAT